MFLVKPALTSKDRLSADLYLTPPNLFRPVSLFQSVSCIIRVNVQSILKTKITVDPSEK